MPAIQQTAPNTYELSARGSRMKLSKHLSGWRMVTANAQTKAWGFGASVKDFESLAEVERHYKSWRGIAMLLNDD